ncbi:oxidoreductase [Actinomycetospora sp. NBRC 106378]|uniref:oxidoreductase n=1 Tax=Actinomycetospora sp. NBRC 106378 TaxID=3032208 RepID=UPI0024A12597|nr:oxidoreductase [Actinomycetospora sp. NBRC 106378]GLZ54420.1 oxidoreductase [Actinomycetospora sp. NBRC 106378]
MITAQQTPIGSGFGARTTAAEVVAGLDLSGRLALVTGGYSGLGLEAVRALTAAGAHVVVPARRRDVAQEALAGLDGVTTDELDLADLDSVAAFADRRLAAGHRLDVVIDNAGVMACPLERVGPGWERQFATNHLGHFALVNRLAPLLDGDSRVVSVSSRGHHFSDLHRDDVHYEHRDYDKWQAYGQSKTANVLFAVGLAARGVRAFALHPGGIMTPLQRHLPLAEMVALGWKDEQGNPGPAAANLKTPEQGAATETWAATSPQLADLSGVYLEDCEVAIAVDTSVPPDSRGGYPGGVMPYAIDADAAEWLWAASVEATGVDGFPR